ncbi:SGNH hydrolase domain-containing protein [Rhizohabitans arisaemae]|uniref:SGNH hydrolase domain-containing protein n=1 Tax=Rhizohabitans arisaemae TaxID=2720610 RepID=UPI0024B1A31A|nr:SGNH hydrolase domain-containing protein [Rhizohabitans arisaemae]
MAAAPPASARSRKPGYHPGFRPDIEGLRAVAVLTVLAFHASIPYFGGGYVGVDVFFVISGFLITGQLLAGIARDGRFSLAEFYARRARRILPAAGVVLTVTGVAAYLVLPPLRLRDTAVDVLTSALNVANWRFVANETDYLLASRDASPVLHFWSLAVEEQFYLVWAPLLLVIALIAGRHRLKAITFGVLAITAGSFALSLHWTATSEPLAYLASPSRAWQFGLGALVALTAPLAVWLTRALRHALLWSGLAAVAGSTVLFDESTPFPGTAALVPTVGAAAIILAGTGLSPVPDPARRQADESETGRGPVPDSEAAPAEGAARPERRPFGGPLRTRPMRAIGRLSFAWYLWHWPVVVLLEAGLGPLSWPVKAVATVAAALPAYLTLRLVERPLRFSAVLSLRPSRGLSAGFSAVVVPVVAALLLGSAAVRVMGDPVPRPDPRGAADGSGLTVEPGAAGMVPHPVLARQDFPPSAGCEIPLTAVISPRCLFGTGERRMTLLGDSHAGQWFSALKPIADRRGWSLEVLVKPGCPLPRLTVVDPRLGREYRECDTWRKNTLDRLVGGAKPELIVISTLGFYPGDPDWAAVIDPLRSLNVPIVYLRDTPSPGFDVPACLSKALNGSGSADRRTIDRCAVPRVSALPPARFIGGVRVVDVTDVLCPGTTCPAVRDGVVMYRDSSHLTDTAAAVLSPRIERHLELLRVIPPLWREVWRDDFTGPQRSRPSQANWQYDLGTCYPGCPAKNWGTGEIETMTDSTANVSLNGDGQLAIAPRRFPDGRWTSGRLTSVRADFQAPPGGVMRVEASLRLPKMNRRDGAGYWPAFWMLGAPFRATYTDWPGAGEVDIMESVNGRGGVFATMHCGTLPDGPCKESSGGLSSGEVPCADCHTRFRTYAAEIDFSTSPQQVRWYLDDREIHRVTADEMDPQTWARTTDHGFFLILNVAMGGALPKAKGGGPTRATVSGRPMLVDHVSVSVRN